MSRPTLALVAASACSGRATAPPDVGTSDPTPQSAAICPDFNPLKNAYFGDLHTHTAYSFDAYTFDTRTDPFHAYAFAKGWPIQIAQGGTTGGPITKLDRPLDFAAITDHSEWLAIDFGCGATVNGVPFDSHSPFYPSLACDAARSNKPIVQDIDIVASFAAQNKLCSGVPHDSATCAPVVHDAWSQEIAAAQAALDPCTFTSFIAYEWTNSCTGDGGTAATCHKNVIFGDTNVPALPFDSLAYPTQESLWAALDTGCNGGACKAITIPHNSNLSKGQAFSIPQGSEAHAQKYQKLVEIFQHKGGSECFSDGSDPECDFNYLGGVTEPNLPSSYVRTGLEQGLVDQATAHVDPLQLGFVGATDDHNGAPGNTREDTWPGHAGRLDDTAAQRISSSDANAVGYNPGGVAVAWAEQNTRDAIFAAFQRRETYATSGPRISVRVYQTWDQTTDFCADPNFPAQIIAAGGRPMGSTMTAGTGKPRIVVYAARDPISRADVGNLGEIDLIEAWVDPATGAAKDSVLRWKAPTADGVATSCQTFTPAFQAGVPSMYYARVLQIPTPRWSVFDCQRAPLANPKDCAVGGKLNQLQTERAWTSPIWYLP